MSRKVGKLIASSVKSVAEQLEKTKAAKGLLVNPFYHVAHESAVSSRINDFFAGKRFYQPQPGVSLGDVVGDISRDFLASDQSKKATFEFLWVMRALRQAVEDFSAQKESFQQVKTMEPIENLPAVVVDDFFKQEEADSDLVRLLVAHPALHDGDCFQCSVVLMLPESDNRYDSDVGFVLNKRMTAPDIYDGGPVHASDLASAVLHRGHGEDLPDSFRFDQKQLASDLFVTYGERAVRHYESLGIENGHEKRLNGFAAWTRNQLQDELDAGYWFEVAGSQDLAFCDSETLWKQILAQLGGEYREFQVLERPPRDFDDFSF